MIYSEELGVYLGNCMGMGFWSKLDPVGQPCAVTFGSEGEAAKHWASWNQIPRDCKTHQVAPSDGRYATIEDCARAGLPIWEP